MIYTELTKKALKLMFEAHKDQVDKCGMPYVFHPFYLANQMNDEIFTQYWRFYMMLTKTLPILFLIYWI